MTTFSSRIQLSRLFDEWNSSGSPLVGTHAATHLYVYKIEIPDESQVDNAVDIKYALVYFGRKGGIFFYSSSPESTPLWTTTPHVLSENKLRQVIRNLTSDFLPASLPKTIPNEVKEKHVPRVLPALVSYYGEMLGQEWTPLPPELPATPAKPVVPPMPLLLQTAAEKFDKVPPWCVVKKGDGSLWGTYSHDLSRFAMNGGHWGTGKVTGTGLWDSEPEALRIARLTRPLPSWEPAPDCALPVEGWNIRKCADGNYGVFTIPDGVFALKALTFSTRREAIVWAWTEAPAPDERKPVEAVPHTVQFEPGPKVIREVPIPKLLQAVCPHCREALKRLLS